MNITTSPKQVFIFGLGYCGLAFANACLKKGWNVCGTTTSIEKQRTLESQGISTTIFDSTSEILIPNNTTQLLCTIAPDKKLIDAVAFFHQSQISKLPHLEWLGYLSATSVYGDYQGAWVSETSRLKAQSDRGLLRIQAEERWLSHQAHIFRLAGIYGPQRNLTDQLRQGTAQRVVKEGQVFSRIHVDDICTILLASIDNPHPGEIYNCADDLCASSDEIIRYLCEKYQLQLPQAIDYNDPKLSVMTRSFYQENRRVDNSKIKTQLKVNLKYPSFLDYY